MRQSLYNTFSTITYLSIANSLVGIPVPLGFPYPRLAPELPPEALITCFFGCCYRGGSPDHGGKLGYKY